MDLPERKPLRLTKYNDADDGYYFVTICTHNKSHLFGNMNHHNEIGRIASNGLESIPHTF